MKCLHYCLKCKETFTALPWSIDCFCNRCKTKLTRLCAKCKKSFNSYKPLKKHVDEMCFSHCVESIHEQCSICDRIFNSQYAFKAHKRICGVKAKFFCTHCDYGAKRKATLEKHVMVHTRVKDHRFVDKKSEYMHFPRFLNFLKIIIIMYVQM